MHLLPVVNKRAPLRRKGIKHPKLPPWTQHIIQAMALPDKLKREKLFDLYKTQRNKVSTLVCTAKINYFDKSGQPLTKSPGNLICNLTVVKAASRSVLSTNTFFY